MTPQCRLGLLVGILAVVALAVAANYVPIPVPPWIVDPAIMLGAPAVYLLLAWSCGVRPHELGLGNPANTLPPSELIPAALVCTFVFAGSAIANWAAAYLLPVSAIDNDFEDPFLSSFGSSLPAIVYGALSTALFEELMLRGALGFVLLGPDTAGRRAGYVIASTALSTILHLPSGDALTVVTGCYVGFVAPFLYVRYRTLWPLIAAHFSWDMLVFWWFSHA